MFSLNGFNQILCLKIRFHQIWQYVIEDKSATEGTNIATKGYILLPPERTLVMTQSWSWVWQLKPNFFEIRNSTAFDRWKQLICSHWLLVRVSNPKAASRSKILWKLLSVTIVGILVSFAPALQYSVCNHTLSSTGTSHTVWKLLGIR